MTAATSPARALPELPEPTMRESNPYLNAPFDPHHGREILHWFNGEQIRAYALTYGQQCAQAQGEAQAAEIAALKALLERCKEWHQGDKWRDGSPDQYKAWEAHMRDLDAALKSEAA